MIEWIVNFIETLGYVGIFVLMFVETVFPPLPSELIMPFAGFSASVGKIDPFWVLVSGTAGSMVGAATIYAIGKILHEDHIEAFIKKRGKLIGIRMADIRKIQKWFDRHGHIAVLLCRLIPGIRSLISLPAGSQKMRLATFTMYSLIGITAWNAILVYGGYILGEEYHRVEEYIKPISRGLIVAIGLVACFLLARRIASARLLKRPELTHGEIPNEDDGHTNKEGNIR